MDSLEPGLSRHADTGLFGPWTLWTLDSLDPGHSGPWTLWSLDCLLNLGSLDSGLLDFMIVGLESLYVE